MYVCLLYIIRMYEHTSFIICQANLVIYFKPVVYPFHLLRRHKYFLSHALSISIDWA
ncbi:hypothetical protein BDV38DRAFT_263846 [Aspergillus pseudotamarii]|uniref:Uncharacterized protein n=1 Tax=Aspergillus pseudotamarii TaxID=132259 RepID=A0A5N6SD43_ASPPS|nr:uncharacterized protein BDV38DRAFT_263846 [Aspergillus pseudotamarii]KAE8131610.1 hypothetical protein BDV38DRAFT_263846 [Aspergillus pseudotamarii]